jgi:hypothetical protein
MVCRNGIYARASEVEEVNIWRFEGGKGRMVEAGELAFASA